jgi:hypothetical protein
MTLVPRLPHEEEDEDDGEELEEEEGVSKFK